MSGEWPGADVVAPRMRYSYTPATYEKRPEEDDRGPEHPDIFNGEALGIYARRGNHHTPRLLLLFHGHAKCTENRQHSRHVRNSRHILKNTALLCKEAGCDHFQNRILCSR